MCLPDENGISNLNGFIQLLEANQKLITTANGGFTSHVREKKICSKLSGIDHTYNYWGLPERLIRAGEGFTSYEWMI